jgi:hypothetical protein
MRYEVSKLQCAGKLMQLCFKNDLGTIWLCAVSRRVLRIGVVVCRFYFIHFVFSFGEKALCNRTKEDCNVLELALAISILYSVFSSHI